MDKRFSVVTAMTLPFRVAAMAQVHSLVQELPHVTKKKKKKKKSNDIQRYPLNIEYNIRYSFISGIFSLEFPVFVRDSICCSSGGFMGFTSLKPIPA